MHYYVMSDSVKERLLHRQGRLSNHDRIDAVRTALVVIDMQNHFVAEGFPAEVPASRDIVPTINRLARAVRIAGGQVVWVQTTATGALEHWANHHKYMLTPERAAKRLASLDESADGFRRCGHGPTRHVCLANGPEPAHLHAGHGPACQPHPFDRPAGAGLYLSPAPRLQEWGGQAALVQLGIPGRLFVAHS